MTDALETPKGFKPNQSEISQLSKIKVTKTDNTKPWNPTLEVTVTLADGTIEE